MSIFDKICEGIRKVLSAVCVILLGAQVLIVAGVAAGRYFFDYTPAWGEKTALLCMVWFCLMSATLALFDDSHLRMTLIDNFVSERAVRYLNILVMAFIFGFGCFMLAAGAGLAVLSARNTMAGLGISNIWLYASVPVTGLSFMVVSLEKGKELLWDRKQ